MHEVKILFGVAEAPNEEPVAITIDEKILGGVTAVAIASNNRGVTSVTITMQAVVVEAKLVVPVISKESS